MADVRPITLEDVRRALALPDFDALAAQERMAPRPRPLRRLDMPGSPREAGVLVLLYPSAAQGDGQGDSGNSDDYSRSDDSRDDGDDGGNNVRSDGADHSELSFVLIRRTEHPGDVHSGQISLPGGRREQGETFEQTALREASEEIGVAQSQVQIIGTLTPLYVPPSDFEIHPIVGYSTGRPTWKPDGSEVAEIIEVPLHWLLDDSRKDSEEVTRYNYPQPFVISYYRVGSDGQHKVWGATAIMLSELEVRLRAVLALPTG